MKVYLDFNATTPIDNRVASEMRPYLDTYFGNPSSIHFFGVDAKKAVEKARKQIADLIQCDLDELIFTSGGTESNNMALKGVAYALKNKGNHIITSKIEHPAILEVCKHLENNGFYISYIDVDEEGSVNIEKLESAITPETILISIMHANNETGVVQPIEEIAQIAHRHQVLFHSDAAQSLGKIEVNTRKTGLDLLSIAGHKLYGPKGIGALFIKRGVKLEKLIHGANHEQNLRAGTENVLEIVGLGKACALAAEELGQRASSMKEMRDHLEKSILNEFPNTKINGIKAPRLPNTSNISFPGIEANILLAELEKDGIAVSAGAACHSEGISLSGVLEAMQIPVNIAMGTLRFSTGKNTTKSEIDYCVEKLKKIVKTLRGENQVPNSTIESGIYKLTQYTQGLGCACKMRPQVLEEILLQLPKTRNKNSIIGTETSDDAAVFKLNEEQYLVQTVDFFTPIVDDPYLFGAIAAANSISDIYAMGAKPLFALNIVGFPTNRLPNSVLKEILRGASDKASEAGIDILGGHTIDDIEPKFGMTVSGISAKKNLILNKGAKPKDVLILTKPIGTGIASTAMKRNLAEPETINEAIMVMSQLNKTAAEIMLNYPVNACTDVTGFGLLGHLSEMTKSSKVRACVHADNVHYITGVKTLALNPNLIPGGTKQNLEYIQGLIKWDSKISETEKYLLADAQTSGGLLISCPQAKSTELLNELIANKLNASIIGEIIDEGSGTINVI